MVGRSSCPPAEQSSSKVRFGPGRAQQKGCHRKVALALLPALPCPALPCLASIDLTEPSRADLSRFPTGGEGQARPGQAKGVAGWDRMGCDVVVGAVRVGGCKCDGPVEGMKAWEFGLRVPVVQTISLRVLYCQSEWREDWRWKGREAVYSLAIQGRVSQNLRLIQVIFGHTASEKKRCACQCVRECAACLYVCVCADQVQAEDDGEFHSEKKDAVV